jgi:hypothetical protein
VLVALGASVPRVLVIIPMMIVIVVAFMRLGDYAACRQQ